MRKAILFFMCGILLFPMLCAAQIRDGYPMDSTIIGFSNDSIANYLPDTAVAPLWQIGRTHKSFFTTDPAGITGIMTDTLGPYGVNANNWFVIKLPYVFNIIVDFWHKYQTASGRDGGLVEFSLDTGMTWQNVRGACNIDTPGGGTASGVLTYNFYGFNDTLFTGEPSFSGVSDSQVYSRVQFFNGYPVKTPSVKLIIK